MPVEFLRTQFTFRMRSRSVHVSGISDGVLIDVIIPRPVLEHLGGAQRLNQDESFTVVLQNLELLRVAAAMAAGRRGGHVPIITVDLADVETCARQFEMKRLTTRLEPTQSSSGSP
jgi:hypothetical protein